jgi:RNA polymerase sigma factor (sigma-70 family)
MDRNDGALLCRYAHEDNERAFGELVERYYPLVHRTAYATTRNSQLADDVTTAVFMLLAKRAHSFEPRTTIAGWLFKTARLTASNALRIEMRRRKLEAKLAEDLEMNATAIPDLGTLAIIDDALARLSERERQTILLRYVQGYSVKEAAEALGCSPVALEKRTTRALEHLRRDCLVHGGTLGATAIAAALFARPAHASVSESIVHAVQSSQLASGSSIHLIYQGAIKQMVFMKLKTAAVFLGAALILGGGGGTALRVHAQKATAKVTQQTKTAPQSPDAAKIEQIALTHPFTLSYQVNFRSVASKTLLDKEIAEIKRSLHVETSGGISVQDATDQFLKIIQKNGGQYTPFDGKAEVSYNGEKLLYIKQSGEKIDIVLTDGERTYTLNGKVNQMWNSPGIPLASAPPIPTSAVGLPFIPLIKNAREKNHSKNVFTGDVYFQFHSIRNVSFIPGEVSVGYVHNKPQIESIIAGTPENVESKWEFSKFRDFEGIRIPEKARLTQYLYGEPNYILDVVLVAVSNQPVSADKFVPETWCNNKTSYSHTDDALPVTIIYSPRRGTLEAEHAIGEAMIRKQKQQHPAPTAPQSTPASTPQPAPTF